MIGRLLAAVKGRIGGGNEHTVSCSAARAAFMRTAFTYAGSNRLEGDYAEFGVWRGGTFLAAYGAWNALRGSFPQFENMRFLAFDSFAGFPEMEGDDRYPQFVPGGRSCSEDDFRANLRAGGVDAGRLSVCKGWYKDTLSAGGPGCAEVSGRRICFAYVDCDLYESTREVLAFLAPRMAPGGVIAFDDWFCFAGHPYKGEQKACREFLAAHPGIYLVPFHLIDWHGKSFILHEVKDPEIRLKLGGNVL
jgi:hypothetical protein